MSASIHSTVVRKLFLGASIVAIALTTGVFSTAATAQSPTTTTQATPVKAKAKIVGFRAPEWKTIHSNSDDQASQIVATLNKLGCEVKTEDHGNHVDIRYRCPNWRSMKLDTDSLVNQWNMWCTTQGMETVVINPPANTKRPTVKFRMTTAKTVHLHDLDKAKQIVNTLTLIGCEVKTADHDGHMDTTFVCPQWTTIELASEDSAHAWMKWLDDSGFETEHTHVK